MKNFLKTKEFKRFCWTILNAVMGLGVAYMAYLASDNVAWAVSALPLATALSQTLTKFLNTK